MLVSEFFAYEVRRAVVSAEVAPGSAVQCVGRFR